MATEHAPLRRPISPQQPMWIIHIDTWNTADPERIIEMVPKDILPYVCFVLSLSATDATCCSGPNVCDAWMKACASKRVWTMIQPSSGAHNRFSDTDYSDYERYFKEIVMGTSHHEPMMRAHKEYTLRRKGRDHERKRKGGLGLYYHIDMNG